MFWVWGGFSPHMKRTDLLNFHGDIHTEEWEVCLSSCLTSVHINQIKTKSSERRAKKSLNSLKSMINMLLYWKPGRKILAEYYFLRICQIFDIQVFHKGGECSVPSRCSLRQQPSFLSESLCTCQVCRVSSFNAVLWIPWCEAKDANSSIALQQPTKLFL